MLTDTTGRYAADFSAVEQGRRNRRLLDLLDALEAVPGHQRDRPAYATMLIELHELCVTEAFYHVIVETYGL